MGTALASASIDAHSFLYTNLSASEFTNHGSHRVDIKISQQKRKEKQVALCIL
jgi:hypothetical protein